MITAIVLATVGAASTAFTAWIRSRQKRLERQDELKARGKPCSPTPKDKR